MAQAVAETMEVEFQLLVNALVFSAKKLFGNFYSRGLI